MHLKVEPRPDNPSLGYALSTLSGVRYRRGDLAESVAINQRRLALADKNYDGPNVWKASALTDAGWQNLELGQFDQGFAQLNEAIAMYTAMQSGERLKPQLPGTGSAPRRRHRSGAGDH